MNKQYALWIMHTVWDFVVLCCALVSVDITHILQDYFTGTAEIIPRRQQSNPEPLFTK